jgi:hypothetical protein
LKQAARLRKYAKNGKLLYGPEPTMKTTVELPDALYRQAKAEAALRGGKLKDLIEEGLRRVLDAPPRYGTSSGSGRADAALTWRGRVRHS